MNPYTYTHIITTLFNIGCFVYLLIGYEDNHKPTIMHTIAAFIICLLGPVGTGFYISHLTID